MSSSRIMVEDLKQFIKLNSCDFKVMYCPKNFNKFADALAAQGSRMAGALDLVTDGVLPCVSLLVASDSASHTT